jgi:hypothetical protein
MSFRDSSPVGDQRLAALRKRSIILPAIPARNNRSLDWFVIGEKKNRERSPADSRHLQNTIV